MASPVAATEPRDSPSTPERADHGGGQGSDQEVGPPPQRQYGAVHGAAQGAAETGCVRAARLCLKPLGLGGAVEICVDASLRRRALVHWLLWLVAGFGWAGLVYFQTFILGDAANAGGAASANVTNASAVPECQFDYAAQLPVLASELPGDYQFQY